MKNASGLPIPRFVSLKSVEAYARVGPGQQYPKAWVFTKPTLPLEVKAEFGDWRLVRDFEGSKGWVHVSLLSGRRYAIVSVHKAGAYEKPDSESTISAFLGVGVIGRLSKCVEKWCLITIRSLGRSLWVRTEDLWGMYAHERRV